MKSVLILFYLFNSLTFLGGLTIASQAMLGFVLCAMGVTMQNRTLYEDPHRVKKAAYWYLWGGLASLVVNLIKWATHLEFFTDPQKVNWFIDFFTGIWKGIKELGLSILFVDRILWTTFSFLLFFISFFYIDVNFNREESHFLRFKQKIEAHFSKHTTVLK